MIKRANRKKLLTGVIAILLLTLAVSAWGKGTANVTDTLHNLSVTSYDPYFFGFNSFYTTDAQEVCVFCHTPHGGEVDMLWNKPLDSLKGTGVFTHYSNATINDPTDGLGLASDRAVGTESLLCLSCHDGSIAVNVVHNVDNSHDKTKYSVDGLGADTEIQFTTKPNARIGGSLTSPGGTGDLSDDHPISFSYDDVLALDIYTTGNRVGELRTVDAAKTWAGEGVRFFGATNRVECSSCHDPHVFYDYDANTDYAPFLIMPNSGSNLCLACHNK